MKKTLLIVLLLCVFASAVFCEDNTSDHISTDESSVTVSTENKNSKNTFYEVFNYAGDTYENEFSQPYFSSDIHLSFITHAYLETMMLHGYPTVGGAVDIGIGIDTIDITAYMRYHHVFRPLGSNTGALVSGEEFGEVGLSMRVKIYELGRFNIRLGVSTGWYQQWLMYAFNEGTYNLVNNGMIIRPEASIGFRFIRNWSMSIGFFYQSPVYPTYSGYEAWGWYVKLI